MDAAELLRMRAEEYARRKPEPATSTRAPSAIARDAIYARRAAAEPVAPEPTDPDAGADARSGFNPFEDDLPSVRDLPEFIADKDAATIRDMMAVDSRKSTQALYEKRLAELED